MYDGYLAFAGTEIVNSNRAAHYARAMNITTINCGGCSTFPRAVYDSPYVGPEEDDAPWFDPVEPASAEFAGFVGLEIVGLSKSVASQGLVPLTDNGAALHPLRRSHREIQVRALAVAKTQCALSYGFSWLAAVLRGRICGATCTGSTLCFFTCCPPSCGAVPTPPDEDTCGDPYWRTLLNAGLIEMEEPAEVKRTSGGWMGQVTFTLAAGNPFIWRDPILMATSGHPGTTLPNYEDPGEPPDCEETSDCLLDPNCPPPPAPILPPIPVDACFPTGPFTAARAIIALPQQKVPIWQEKVPLIFLKSGSKQLERLTLRWYGNPLDLPCDTVDACNACAEVNIAFLPANATLTIDGRTETAYVDCPGGPGLATAQPQLYGRGGTPFVWPVFSCADGACLEVIAKADTVAVDSNIEIYYVVREDAA